MIINFFIFIALLLCIYILWRYNRKKIKTYISPLQGNIVVWEKYNREKLLTINDYSQGVSINDASIKKSYWYKVSQQVLSICKKKKNPRVLILGLGANTIPLLIQKEKPDVVFTIVEIDPQIIQACKDWFALDSLNNLTLIRDDAYKTIYMTKKIHAPFDAIVVDIFTGKSGVVHSMEEKFIEQLVKLLYSKGVLVFNWPANTQKTKVEASEIIKNCQKIGLQVSKDYIKDPRGYKNFVITAKI